MPSSDPYATLPRHSATCICRRCRDARRRAEFESWRQYQEVERVFSDEASAHIHQLIRLGWKQAEIAAAAGVAPSTVSTAKERVELPGAGSCPAEWCVRAAAGTAMVHPGAGGACLGSRLRERLGFPPDGSLAHAPFHRASPAFTPAQWRRGLRA